MGRTGLDPLTKSMQHRHVFPKASSIHVYIRPSALSPGPDPSPIDSRQGSDLADPQGGMGLVICNLCSRSCIFQDVFIKHHCCGNLVLPLSQPGKQGT